MRGVAVLDVALAAGLVLVLSGCLSTQSSSPPTNPGDLAEARVVDVGISTYEPSIAIDAAGRVFVNGYTVETGDRGAWGVWKSGDGGSTWTQAVDEEDRTPGSGDPWLWLDPATDRIFSVDLPTPTCGWLVWSDDAGDTWEKVPAAGCGLPAHHFQKLTGGAPPAGIQTQAYPSVLYYSTTSLRDPDVQNPTDLLVGGTGTDVSVSLDGGQSWSISVRVHPPTPGGYSQAGPVAVAPDGTAYSPAQTDNGVRVARSTDAGRTWSLVANLEDAGYQPYGADPSLAIDSQGHLHLLHASREGLPVLRSSDDGGQSWTAPQVISPQDIRSSVFPLVRAFDNGSLAVAYLGTTADAADPSYAGNDSEWRLYLAVVETGTEPSVRTIVAEADPVQRGAVWMRGGDQPSRNLGDFMGLAARDGLIAVGFVDGCIACPVGEQSTGDAARVALWRPQV